jgi:hypothetical protein
MAIKEAQQETQVLTNLTLKDLQWSNLPVNVLSWMADLQNITINGTIDIDETVSTGNAVTFTLKEKFIRKWGNVDDDDVSQGYRGLLLSYTRRPFAVDPSVRGNFYVEAGNDFQFSIRPNSQYENAFTNIVWRVEKANSGLQQGVEIESNTGLLHVTQPLSASRTIFSVYASITTYDKANDSYGLVTVHKEIEIWNRPAQLGDYVYHDGTYSSVETYDGEKHVIGVCCYIAPRYTANDPEGAYQEGDIVPDLFNPNDRMQRLMVSLNNLSSFQWGAYYNNGTSAANELYDYNTAESTMANRKLQVVDLNGNVLL